MGCTNGPIGHATELLTIGARIFFSNFEEFYAFKWIPGEYVDVHLWAAWGWMLGNAFEGKHAKTRTIWDGRGTEVGNDHCICKRQHFSSSHCKVAKFYWEIWRSVRLAKWPALGNEPKMGGRSVGSTCSYVDSMAWCLALQYHVERCLSSALENKLVLEWAGHDILLFLLFLFHSVNCTTVHFFFPSKFSFPLRLILENNFSPGTLNSFSLRLSLQGG